MLEPTSSSLLLTTETRMIIILTFAYWILSLYFLYLAFNEIVSILSEIIEVSITDIQRLIDKIRFELDKKQDKL